MGSILLQATRQIPGNRKENIEGWGWGCRATKSNSKEFKVIKEHYVQIWKLHHKNNYFVQRIYSKYLNTTQSWPFCTLKLLESGRINTCIHTHMHTHTCMNITWQSVLLYLWPTDACFVSILRQFFFLFPFHLLFSHLHVLPFYLQ